MRYFKKLKSIGNDNYIGYDHKGNREQFHSDNEQDFINYLKNIQREIDFKKLFSSSNTSKRKVGNQFTIRIANGFKQTDLSDIIDLSWDLFLWLYPSKPLFRRDACLNRSLKNIARKCEYLSIKKIPKNIKEENCSGQIEGAHIKPHKLGGNDKLENGIWLCARHHKLTEGKIKGTRTIKIINVDFIS